MESAKRLALILPLLLLGSCATVSTGISNSISSNTSGAAFGRPVSESELAAWNIDIRTQDGVGLPVGKGDAVRGKVVYEQKCVACHGPDAKGGPVFGTMVGAYCKLKTAYAQRRDAVGKRLAIYANGTCSSANYRNK